MANNTTIQLPTTAGDIISTEDVSGVKIPRSKIALGASGVDGGNVSDANPFPINVKNSVSLAPTTSGGSSIYRNIDLGVTGQVVKASAGQLYGWYIFNAAASTRYLKIYNKATAATQADTPVYTIPIPAGAAANVSFPDGDAFGMGISVRASTGLADSDTGAPTTNDVVVNLRYK